MIELEHVSKQFGGKRNVSALNDVHVTIGKAERVAIIGPSGSGKSTLLNLVGGLDRPTSGEVRVGGKPLAGLSDDDLTRVRRDTIGFVFQFFNLLPALSAEENVLLPALISGRRDAATRDRAHGLLERVGLGERANHLPAELSGGEQQRVSIARALLMNPELVLADEPTGNLDTTSSGEVLSLLRELNRKDGHTIVLVTHDPDAASKAGRVVFLRDGKIAGEIRGGSTKRVSERFAALG
jgi:putative ABC transport system ATP-binding protein